MIKKKSQKDCFKYITANYPEIIKEYERSLMDPSTIKAGTMVRTLKPGFSGPAGIIRQIAEPNPYPLLNNPRPAFLLIDPNNSSKRGISYYENWPYDFEIIE